MIAGLVLCGLLAARPELLLLAVPFTLHLTIGLALGPTDRGPLVLAHDVTPPRILEGEEVDVEMTLEWRGRGRAIAVIEDPSGIADHVRTGDVWRVGLIDHDRPLHLRYRAQLPRGRYAVAHIRVALANLLGFVTWRGEVPCQCQAIALPQIEQLGGITFTPRRSLVRSGTVRARRGGPGIEFFQSRSYLPGDDLRRLNWKALARWDRLVINEHEEERAADVFVVLDVRLIAYEKHRLPEPLFDASARAAASVTDYALRQGHSVGLLLYGEKLDWILPGSGQRHAERLLTALARAQPATSHVFADLAHLPARFLSRGCQIVFVSPLLTHDAEALAALRGRGYAVMALIPDPLSLTEETPQGDPTLDLARRIGYLDRQVLLWDLNAGGVRPLVWDVRAPLAPQARAAWRRPW